MTKRQKHRMQTANAHTRMSKSQTLTTVIVETLTEDEANAIKDLRVSNTLTTGSVMMNMETGSKEQKCDAWKLRGKTNETFFCTV